MKRVAGQEFRGKRDEKQREILAKFILLLKNRDASNKEATTTVATEFPVPQEVPQEISEKMAETPVQAQWVLMASLHWRAILRSPGSLW